MKIFIADDHPSIRYLYREILSNEGYDIVAETNNGYDTLASYFKVSPDLLIIDHDMGVLKGIDVVREIKQKDHKAKIMMCTSNTYEIMDEAEKLGVKVIHSKPFCLDNFIESVSKTLHDS